MRSIIRYFYKDALVLEEVLPSDGVEMGWANNNPPYQPNNWDRWEVKEVTPPYTLYHPTEQRELVF